MNPKEITGEDLRRIRISCRCGTRSIAEVPEQLAKVLHVHLCPNCRALFGIQKRDDNWKIARMEIPEGTR
jgi:hypothetical protein